MSRKLLLGTILFFSVALGPLLPPIDGFPAGTEADSFADLGRDEVWAKSLFNQQSSWLDSMFKQDVLVVGAGFHGNQEGFLMPNGFNVDRGVHGLPGTQGPPEFKISNPSKLVVLRKNSANSEITCRLAPGKGTERCGFWALWDNTSLPSERVVLEAVRIGPREFAVVEAGLLRKLLRSGVLRGEG